MSTTDRAVAPPRPISLDALSEPATYAHYRRLFAAGLARLAARGFAAPPDEGLDLIHGFFVDLWADVAPRHDPERGKFDSYIFGCFVNYARPRIVRLRRTRGLLVEPALIEIALAAMPSVDEHETEPLDLATVRRALGRLPALARLVLQHYLDDETPSEREVATKFGLTRYATRMQLSDAIGSVMVALGDLAALSETDRSIAGSLFGHRRTVRETARLLGRDVAEIQDARTRWLGLLIQAVKGKRSMDTKRYTPPSVDDPSGGRAADLLVAALRSEAGEEASAALRENGEAIWQFLERSEAERLLAPYAEADPARLARVYSLLADVPDSAALFESAEYDAFLSVRENEECTIGKVFEVLMSGLEGDLARPWVYFRGLPEVDPDTFDQLRREPSVRAANGLTIDMVRHGITPVTIAEASSSLSSLALRFCRQHGIEVEGRLILEGRSSAADNGEQLPVLRRQDAIDNLANSIDLPRSVLEKTYDWLWDAAGFVPLFFEDFETYALHGRLTLIRTDRAEPDLLKRWHAPVEHQVSLYGYA